VNAMGFGLDAEVGRRFNLLTRRGLPAYARTALSAFLGRTTERCLVSYGGHDEAVEALLIAVANSDQYGNHAKIAPHARVDDGVLDMVIVRPVGFAAACVLGARLFLGSIDQSRDVRRVRSARFLVERRQPGIIHTDGEIHTTSARLDIQARPRSLRFVVPEDCTALAPAEAPEGLGFALQLP
jgi:diacylglycerol kinase (ATP)